MRRFDFDQTGGFELVTESLSGLQEAYSIYTGALKMAGDRAILSGCEELGGTVTDGFVYINGELLEFKGAVKQDTVIIKEETTTVQFEDGTVKPFETYRYVTFGYSTVSIPWNSFKRVPPLNEIPAQLSALNTKIDSFIIALGYLRKGEVFIGDVNGKTIGWEYVGTDYKVKLINNTNGSGGGGDDHYQITLNNALEDANYKIFTSIRYNGNYVANNDVIVTVSNLTTTGFQFSVRELSQDTQNITVDYIIFKK